VKQRLTNLPTSASRRALATPAKPAAAATPAVAGGGKAPAKGGAAAAGKKKKVGKESKLGNTLTQGSTGFVVGEKIPIGIFKDGQDPTVKLDAEYPSWLWKVNELPTLSDCVKMVQKNDEEGRKDITLITRMNRLNRNVSEDSSG